MYKARIRRMSSQIIAKDNDLKIISKIVEFLAEGQDVKRSRTFLEITDAHGRAFRYVSTKERPESKGLGRGKEEVRRIDDAFMAEHMSEKNTPRTLLHAYLENAEEDEEEDDDESSDQED